METHKLDNWAALYSKYSLSVQRAKMIIIISFLFVAFPSSISYANDIESIYVLSTVTWKPSNQWINSNLLNKSAWK